MMNGQMDETMTEIASGLSEDNQRRKILMSEAGDVFIASGDDEPKPATLREAVLCYQEIYTECNTCDFGRFLLAIADQLPNK